MRGKRALFNITFSLISQVITIICGFVVPKLIISIYGSNVNGLISSITQLLAFITLLEAGFGSVIKSLLYKPIANKNKEELENILKSSERIFRTISYIFIIYIIILCIFLPLFFNNSFDNLLTLSLVIAISISTFFEYYFGITYRLFIQANQQNYIVSIIQIVTLVLNTLMIVLLIRLNASITIVKLFSSIIFLLRPIIQNIYANKKYKINLKNVKSNYKIRQKWDGLVQHIAHIVHTNTDIIIITLFCPISEVSVYSVYFLIINSIKNIICYSFVSGIDSIFGDMIAKGEKDKLDSSFKKYESLYLTISSIIFICVFYLIVPFIKVYTKGIMDANYMRPTFAYIMVIAEFIYVIRQLYYSLVKVSGHFKETKKGAIVEALSNIIVSIILVNKLGIVGVAIGTLIAMIIRTTEIVCYTSKYILNRSIFYFIKRFIMIVFEFLIIAFIINLIPLIEINSYFTWIVEAIIIFMISLITIAFINSIVYKNEFKELITILKNTISRKKE